MPLHVFPGSIENQETAEDCVSDHTWNFPEIQLMSGTQYKSDNPEWRRADSNVTNATLMKCISVGNGGVWAINAKDNGVMCR